MPINTIILIIFFSITKLQVHISLLLFHHRKTKLFHKETLSLSLSEFIEILFTVSFRKLGFQIHCSLYKIKLDLALKKVCIFTVS